MSNSRTHIPSPTSLTLAALAFVSSHGRRSEGLRPFAVTVVTRSTSARNLHSATAASSLSAWSSSTMEHVGRLPV